MTALLELQTTRPNTIERTRPAVVAACGISVARWMKGLGISVETFCQIADSVARILESALGDADRPAVLFSAGPDGVRVFVNADPLRLAQFIAGAEAGGNQVFGINPGRLAEEARAGLGGAAHARARTLH